MIWSKQAGRMMWLLGGLCLWSLTAVADIQDRGYFSKANNREIKIKVYTPPGDETGRERYPVVYNLHGAGGSTPDRQWDRTRAALTGAMDNRRVRPMIYVFVDGLAQHLFREHVRWFAQGGDDLHQRTDPARGRPLADDRRQAGTRD